MPTTVCSRNEDCAGCLKHLCMKTLKPNVCDSQLVWDIQHLGFLQAEGSHNGWGWKAPLEAGCSSCPAQAGCPETCLDSFCTAPRMDTAQPTLLGSQCCHPQQKLMSCTGKKLRVASVQRFLSMLFVSVLGCYRTRCWGPFSVLSYKAFPSLRAAPYWLWALGISWKDCRQIQHMSNELLFYKFGTAVGLFPRCFVRNLIRSGSFN